KRRLEQLAQWLDREGHTGAAGSVREGLEETLTVLRFKLPEVLRRFISCTNAIENMIGSLRRTTRNVKRWRGGDMKLRWAALALCEAEARFHGIKGQRGVAALEVAVTNCGEMTATKAVA